MRTCLCLVLVAILTAACARAKETASPACSLEKQLSAAEHRKGNDPVALLSCPVDTVFKIGGPIKVDVAIANIADSVVRIRPGLVFGTWLDAQITGPDGRVLKKVGHIDAGLGPFTYLAPGRMLRTTIDLRCALKTDGGAGCISPYRFNTVGRYSITMSYSYACDFGPCESGQLKIDKVTAPAFSVSLRGG